VSTRLVILGLLKRQNLHGYELKHIIEKHMGDWTKIAFGSIYFALGKLQKEGFVEPVETVSEGNRPSRTVYRITDSGEEEFLRLLRAVWSDPEQQYYSIDIGVGFMQALPAEEIRSLLVERVAVLASTVEYIRRHKEEQMTQPNVPRSARAIFDHGLAHTEAELEWTRSLLRDVEAGQLP
jgi:DNA-binding PadR family transcriptional regulator